MFVDLPLRQGMSGGWIIASLAFSLVEFVLSDAD